MPKWKFDDYVTPETYVFEISPNTGGEPQLSKQITYQSPAAADGSMIIMEGRDAAQTGQFSGIILSESQYNAMVHWFTKRHQIKVTDDLLREFWIYITGFKPTRKWSRSYPWKHEYSVEYVILDVAA